MIRLVRCSNGACTLALEKCLAGLITDGLITAFLYEGRWVRTDLIIRPRRRRSPQARDNAYG